jgi:crotonobetainyl-CoA:carnitine CoA-transferase CaiB-like acyl-CoA transferase
MLQDLAELVDVDRHGVRVVGPRAWWCGQLNVEGLALGSVQAALTAANAIAPTATTVEAAAVAANFDSIRHLRVVGRAPEAFAPMSGYFRCIDGWLRTHANFPHHADALRRAAGAQNRDELAAVLAERSATEAEASIRAQGGIAGAVRTRDQWEASEQGRAVAAEPWIRFHPAERDQPVRLQGLRVLDFTRVLAGPTATKFLASLGADVLRIDPPQMPELLDQHLDTGAGKRSALADLRDPATLEVVGELAGSADVVILGYRPGALSRFGLGPEELHASHPHLAVVHLDAWGDTGPWSDQRGFDSVVQAPTGIGNAYRGPDGAPGRLPVQALDFATGYGAAAAALALLRRGGVAHLSLARTAQELFSLPAAAGVPAELEVDVCDVESSYGTLRQVRPLIGHALPPGTYGRSTLTWASP